jgi:peptidoglycan hydrolase-like protein with peptidoglycan-binding domain
MHQSVRDGFITFNSPLEGRVRFMYLDIKSLVSTGIGNLLDTDDPSHFGSNPHLMAYAYGLGWFDKNDGTQTAVSNAEIDAEYTTVKFSGSATWSIQQKETLTRLRITDATIDQLVLNKFSEMETVLRGRPPFAGFDTWPADAQLGLLSMAWAMGPAFNFPNFQSGAASNDFRIMARECKMTEAGNPGVIPRNVRDALLFLNASWNAAPPPGDLTQLCFDPTLSLADNMRSFRFPVPIDQTIGIQTALDLLATSAGQPTWNPNGLDGVVGPGTRTALTNFQRDHQLPQTPGITSADDVPIATKNVLTTELDAQNISWWR